MLACEMVWCSLLVRIVFWFWCLWWVEPNPLISTGALGSDEVQHFKYKRCCPNPLVSIGDRVECLAARWYFAVRTVVHLLLKRKFEAFIRIAKADLRSIEMFGIEVFAKPVQ